MSEEVRDLTTAEIEKASARTIERQIVPEWGGAVYLRTMTAFERDEWNSQNLREKTKGQGYEPNMRNQMARLLVYTLCDRNGIQLYENPARIGALNAKPITRLYERAQQMNGFTKEDVEQMAGNSEPVPSGSSS